MRTILEVFKNQSGELKYILSVDRTPDDKSLFHLAFDLIGIHCLVDYPDENPDKLSNKDLAERLVKYISDEEIELTDEESDSIAEGLRKDWEEWKSEVKALKVKKSW